MNRVNRRSGIGALIAIYAMWSIAPANAERTLPKSSGPAGEANAPGDGSPPMAAGGNPRAEAMLKQRQKDMLEMHELMHRIREAKDPSEKARLMDQHLQMLRDSWQDMKMQRRHRPHGPGGPKEMPPGPASSGSPSDEPSDDDMR